MKQILLSSVLTLTLLSTGCSVDFAASGPPSFNDYWFSGKAELSRYELQQARYGQMRDGESVLIFVTEDFLPDKQVKADSSNRALTGAWPVLKLNSTKKFSTGLYPYSMMTSTFTPLELDKHPHTLKTTTSVQEWCGQTFLQLNLADENYRVRGYSYFETEGDQDYLLPRSWLEEEVWTRVRLAPDSLPTGKFTMIPGGMQSRLRHRDPAGEPAEGALAGDNGGLRSYTVNYPESGRSLTIYFETAFPHRIEGWKETYRDGGRELTTTAKRTHSERLPYWNLNGNDDTHWREKLGLD
ncbi:hypothetical protein ABI59_22795 [Acidobacteria bacterium Mor1]|nr:hypothetical protein ABI59_22795 [Acidobacteria bacterium Mor1]